MDGSKELVASFKALGITDGELSGMQVDDLLLRISDGYTSASDKGAAYAAVIDVLGRGGRTMVAGLSAGSDAIREQAAAASKMSAEEIAALACEKFKFYCE